MAKLYISEYRTIAGVGPNGAPMGQEPSLDQAPITVSGSSVTSLAFTASTHVIRVETDTTCSIVIGTTPVATTSNKRLAANTPEYFGVVPGMLLAVISNT